VWGFAGVSGASTSPGSPGGASGGLTSPGSPGAQPKPQPVPERESDALQRERSAKNLKHILIAIHNYNDVHDQFPGNITDADGKPLLSWRVAILPYIGTGQKALYGQFRLDEPWDSEHNKKFLAVMPDVYQTGIEPKGSTKTYYQGFAGPGTVFEPKQRLTFAHVPDGTANTLAVVEAGPPVEWTKPADIPYDPEKPLPKLELPFRNVLMVGVADGSALPLPPDLNETLLRWLVERADGNVIVPGLAELRVRFRPLNAEDQKIAADLLKRNAELTKQLADLLAEQQKLIEEDAKKRNPADPTKELDIDLLQVRERALRQMLDRMKQATEELRRSPPPAEPLKK
jgi:hypothetical protein